ncbi:nuclear transport factor 2 family protein [Aurantiacibacter poecillastricola]|uniref:nuclear transport factor 2 family protein n=1 Tax=Aurantiacibacter poecillastricola TaxID=3064385 RepID=UPI00273F516D|nr:nuclear transport factor 2 family protein [Aurantiacibacter sp. 219JJ12-13]MDP5263253.1 nuclear transport factor 2 family protein [Aurantiacibacter sp. 219JJ12-13]
MKLTRQIATALLLGAAPAALAQPLDREDIFDLARDVDRVESLRAVKDLQRFYAQFAQHGMAEEMADLFTDDAEFHWGDQTVVGKAAIARFLQTRIGPRGLAPGAIHTELIEDPLVNLSVDGQTAEGRWMGMTLAGDGSGNTVIEGGIYENDFVLDQGIWKISRLEYFPQYDGNYEDGWRNIGNTELAQFPFHFSVDETGIPIPEPAGNAPPTNATLAGLESRIAALNIEDDVRNLQNAYGYYVDRRMWDDVVDLFARDATVEIAGTGSYTGHEGVRAAMETMGPKGLVRGVFNDHPIFSTLVTVSPDGKEAITRGIALGMLGADGEGAWEFQVFRNRFVMEDGLWKFAELRLFPLLRADYEEGWGAGGIRHLAHGVLPAFAEPHPVTGQAIAIDGFTLSADPENDRPGASLVAAVGADTNDIARYLEAERRLRRSWAYDGVVNVSSAYGYYLDEFEWQALASIFASEGNKHSPFAGFYLGQDRIRAAATAMWGEPPETRPSISFHWRFQPVIHVSHDGRSANLRTRLFQPRTTIIGRDTGDRISDVGFNSGMYPNDQAVLEDGIWRLWSLTIDEHYMLSEFHEGWAAVAPTPPGEGGGQSVLVERLAPDILMTELGRRAEHFRGGTGVTYTWPDILPMWFHYKNPVSGRVPDNYWPDSVPGLDLPEARLVAHGYQMPPNGPQRDGIHIELTPPEANLMKSSEGN